MLYWIEPVTDRTQNDVNRVKELKAKGWDNMTSDEQEEWVHGLKGSMNYSDFMRVRNNILLLSDVLGLGIELEEPPNFVAIDYVKRIREYVDTIRNAYVTHFDTPVTPNNPINTYDKWNKLEYIMQDVYEILTGNFFHYCGDGLYMGAEGIGLID